jgi:hypothetical protein
MAAGVGLVALLTPTLNWLLRLIPTSPSNAPTLLGCLVAGGVGAVLSVMSRLTSNKLAIDHEAGKVVTFVLGAFRPIVGGIFAGVLYLFLQSGLIALTPPTPTRAVLFYWSVSFIAGFSERWVPDMLSSVQGSLALESDEPRVIRGPRAPGAAARRRATIAPGVRSGQGAGTPNAGTGRPGLG